MIRLCAILLTLTFALAAAEPPAGAVSPVKPVKTVTLKDAKRKKGKYKTPKPHTAKRAKNAHRRIRGAKQAHPVWGKVKSTGKR